MSFWISRKRPFLYCFTTYEHRRPGTFGPGGGDFLARKIYVIPECTQIARKKNSFPIYRVAGNFSWEFNFADFGFFRSVPGEKNREFGFQTLLVGITFHGCHVQYLKVTEMESYMAVFFTLFATNFIEGFSNV